MFARKWIGWTVCFLGLFAFFMGTKAPVVAQEDVPLPISWNGEGHLAAIFEADEVDTAEFDIELTIDEDGWVTGEITSDQKTAKVERFYYTQPSKDVRKVVLIVVTQDDEPMLGIFDGKSKKDKLYFGDLYIKSFEEQGEIEQDLDLGNLMATEIWSDYIPSALKKAMKESELVGGFGIKGQYQ